MICVSYTRTMSCSLLEEVPEDIISTQNKRIAEYAAKRRWKITKKYSDRKSDRDEDTAFRNLKEDGISQKFDCVIFDSIYRFGTSVYHAYDALYKIFYPGGIHFVCVEDDICSLDYTEEEVKRYLNAKRDEFKKLHYKETTGRCIEMRHYNKYGYRYIDGTMELEIDEKVADNIRTIFKLISEGFTLKETADYMNKHGIEPPNSYLIRMGTNRRWTKDKEGWLCSHIGNITSNRMYAGVLSRTIKCEKVTVPCPAIVSEELFDKVQALKIAKRRGTRSKIRLTDNPLLRMFFDYDSGWPIQKSKMQSVTRDPIFKIKYPKPKEVNYPKPWIPYDEVIVSVRNLLLKEREKAQLAERMIDTPELFAYKEKLLEEIRWKAQAVFKRMTEAEYSAWQNGTVSSAEEFQENDAVLQDLLLQTSELEMFLSKKNPWIRLYSGLELSDNLTSYEVKKYIVRATCEKFETVRIEIKEKDAFLALPQEWFAEV